NKLERIAAAQSPRLKSKSLIVLMRECPLYLERLEPDERDADTFSYQTCARIWQNSGYNCTIIGGDFEPEDYADPRHLSPSGGEKLSKLMADKVRQIANDLGYEKNAN
ncbi:MAG TPA: hypothetical protein V6C72_19285, partial [Chroococcales cyanobacterium]